MQPVLREIWEPQSQAERGWRALQQLGLREERGDEECVEDLTYAILSSMRYTSAEAWDGIAIAVRGWMFAHPTRASP